MCCKCDEDPFAELLGCLFWPIVILVVLGVLAAGGRHGSKPAQPQPPNLERNAPTKEDEIRKEIEKRTHTDYRPAPTPPVYYRSSPPPPSSSELSPYVKKWLEDEFGPVRKDASKR